MALNRIALSCMVAAAALCASLPGPAQAHHGGAVEYDTTRLLGPVTGAVVEFAFRFPHPQIYIDVTDEEGNLERWAFVLQPTPAALRRTHGWGRDSIKPGDTLAVSYSPHRTAENVGFARRLWLNGEPLYEQ
jgi:hypothetical protein